MAPEQADAAPDQPRFSKSYIINTFVASKSEEESASGIIAENEPSIDDKAISKDPAPERPEVPSKVDEHIRVRIAEAFQKIGFDQLSSMSGHLRTEAVQNYVKEVMGQNGPAATKTTVSSKTIDKLWQKWKAAVTASRQKWA